MSEIIAKIGKEKRFIEISDRCPVNKTLLGEIKITTTELACEDLT